MHYYSIKASYEVKTPARLPEFPGFMIRGILGEKLKKRSCIYRNNWKNAKCNRCKEIKTCAYGYSYELGKDMERKYISAMPPPRLFSIDFPEGKSYDQGEKIEFKINVFHRKSWFAEMFKKSLEEINEIGRDRKRGYGKVELEKVEIKEKKLEKQKFIGDRIRAGFITPTAIERDKVMVYSPSLYDVLINAGRKYYLINSLYYKKEGINNLKLLTDIKGKFSIYLEKTNIKKVDRWSERRKKREHFTGILGSITYSLEGILEKEVKEEIKKIIGFANVYGVGKRVSAGMGKVRISSYYSKP